MSNAPEMIEWENPGFWWQPLCEDGKTFKRRQWFNMLYDKWEYGFKASYSNIRKSEINILSRLMDDHNFIEPILKARFGFRIDAYRFAKDFRNRFSWLRTDDRAS